MPLSSPRLWIVAAPIGNPGDLSERAREILEGADLILAEDTRRTALMLAEAGVEYECLVSFFEHNEAARQPMALDALRRGANVALITDAGTPLISDPGFRLTRACREAGLPVSPVPGPSAPIAALSAAGIAPLPFTFLGFLPRGRGDRKALFSQYGATPATLVFFERKDRVYESLELALGCLGDRECAICRELTKEYEEFIIGRLAAMREPREPLRGEITVVIGPQAKDAQTPEAEVRQLLRAARTSGLKNRDAARRVKAQSLGWSVAELYNILVNNSD